MRVGVICDDRYHPAAVVRDGLTALNIAGAQWEFVTDTTAWSRAQRDTYDLIVLGKSNARSATDYAPWLTEEVQQDFVDYVERGNGLLVIHSGTVGYREEPIFRALIGGGFAHHPAPGPVQIEPVGAFPLPGPPPTVYSIYDEHYLMEMFHDDLQVFQTATANAVVQPAGWTRHQGKGRICVLTPGHYAEVWSHPEFQRTVESAFHWCAGEGS